MFLITVFARVWDTRNCFMYRHMFISIHVTVALAIGAKVEEYRSLIGTGVGRADGVD